MDYCSGKEMETTWTKFREGWSRFHGYFLFHKLSRIRGVEPLWKMFTGWGKVVDVYLPKKRNKEGKLFGFVRFDQVLQVQELEVRLHMIWIGLHKLQVNLSRFSRHQVERVPEGTRKPSKRPLRGGEFVKQGLNFVDVVKGATRVQWRPKATATGDEAGEEEWRGLDFNIHEVEMKWLEKCYVGEVHSPTMVESVQDRILEEGVTSMRVIPMGVSHVLLKPVEGEDLEELINDSGGFLDNWFSRNVKWLPMEVSRERYTWIRCHGIPLHAWTAEVFESIVASLGRFITLDDNTFNMKRFDMPRILILTSSPEAVEKV